MRNSLIVASVMVAMLCMVGTVLATVTFDPNTGVGFVGKGDVQIAFGLNNAQIQQYMDDDAFSFYYSSTDSYNINKVFATGNKLSNYKSHLDLLRTQDISENAVFGSDSRKVHGQQQYTGFELTGFEGDPIISGGTLPVESDIDWEVLIDPATGEPYIDQDGNTVTLPYKADGTTLYSANDPAIQVELVGSTGGLYAKLPGGSPVLVWSSS
jgi:sulfur relay (sulfurtransferase) DsrF/TusC family protein